MTEQPAGTAMEGTSRADAGPSVATTTPWVSIRSPLSNSTDCGCTAELNRVLNQRAAGGQGGPDDSLRPDPPTTPGPGSGPGCGRGGVGDLGADLARRGALGKSSVRVLRAAYAGATDVVSLTSATGMSPASVRHHVRKLSSGGLLARSGSLVVCTWTAAGGLALSEHAGTAGRREAERALVLAERAGRWRAGKGPGPGKDDRPNAPH